MDALGNKLGQSESESQVWMLKSIGVEWYKYEWINPLCYELQVIATKSDLKISDNVGGFQ